MWVPLSPGSNLSPPSLYLLWVQKPEDMDLGPGLAVPLIGEVIPHPQPEFSNLHNGGNSICSAHNA